jgi:hypothetical protein
MEDEIMPEIAQDNQWWFSRSALREQVEHLDHIVLSINGRSCHMNRSRPDKHGRPTLSFTFEEPEDLQYWRELRGKLVEMALAEVPDQPDLADGDNDEHPPVATNPHDSATSGTRLPEEDRPTCLSEKGLVLGIDVGYSLTKKTTGLCLLAWDKNHITWQCVNTGTAIQSRKEALNQLVRGYQGRDVLAVAIDGPLRPNLIVDDENYRAAESLLSCGRFQKRGKPGPTNGGSGPQLHREATTLARFALKHTCVAKSAYVQAIYESAVVEAFPNLFLGVLCDEAKYPERPNEHRRWTDTLFPMVQPVLAALVSNLLPGRTHSGSWDLHNHEMIAGLTCAITALCLAGRRFVAVGSPADGYVILPPRSSWGSSAHNNNERWAARELERAINNKRLRRKFPRATVWCDGDRWLQTP